MSFDDVANRMKNRHQGGQAPDDPYLAWSQANGEKRSRAHANIIFGVILLVVGIGITAWTHSAAVDNGGGTYVVAYGPIVVGVIKLVRGLALLS